MGYGADMVVTANAFIYNYGMENFYAKAVNDFANDQQPDGGITEIAPFTGIADRGYGGVSGPMGWQLAFPFLQKQLYDFYGDQRIIEQHYGRVKRQIAFLKSVSYEGLFHWDIGDHEALDPSAEAFSASAFYYHHALLAAELAGLMDEQKDSIEFAKLGSQIKRAIVRKYLVPNTGRFDNATQGAQIMALWYGLSPEEENSLQVLMKEFERHNFHVSSGIFGVKMMFDVLRERDKNDIAYRVATQKSYPGWGHMVESGATSLWEQWKYPERYASQNHPMFGSISEWFFRSLGGINPAATAFKRIRIKPQPAGDLTSVKCSYNSVRGKIVSEWHKEGDRFFLNVTVPVNTTAEVWILADDADSVQEGNTPVSKIAVKNQRTEGKYLVVEVGSGTYAFASSIN
jgi:alpha-L-rhamnosidase